MFHLIMIWLAIILLTATSDVRGQLNAQSSIAPLLRECYTNGELLDRNNLPPTTMSVLIDIIRKIEDHPDVNMDMRQLVASILQTYRQDGIEFHQTESNMPISSAVLPFAPTFHSFYRLRLLLTRIIPGNLQVLPIDVLNSPLKCALHHMLSTTVDFRIRGNENSCNTLSQYRALRTFRDVSRQIIKDDVEILDLPSINSVDKNGQMRQYNPNDDIEYTDINCFKSERQIQIQSQCPILEGVVSTRWGAVSAGNVLAGIAGGAQYQTIPISELARGTIIDNQNIQQFVTSTYPTTLSGDLAEAVLIQNTETGTSNITVGTAGYWNSSQVQRFYMLHSPNNVEMTEPELRGGIDGFVLGNIVNSELQGSSVKLSQLLDMYYTQMNGVFSQTRRACNRRSLSQEFISNTNLVAETNAFAAALDKNIPLRGTIIGNLEELVNGAVTNFQSYVSNNINDINCQQVVHFMRNSRLKTNLYLVVDSSWRYQAIYTSISWLLDNMDVGKFGSSVTLLSAYDGSVIINKTFSLADFHTNYTLSKHQSMLSGVNLETTLTNIRISMHSELENEKTANYVGGNSTVLLFLLNSAVQNTQLVQEQARILHETVPDLRILFATSTYQRDTLWPLVRNLYTDIITTHGYVDNMAIVLRQIQRVGRRIINPTCGSTYPIEANSNTMQFDDYVEPGYVNYYSVSPNYFYGSNGNRRIRITRSGAGVGDLVICYSRVDIQPSQNTTTGTDQTNQNAICETIASSGSVEIGLQTPCEGYYTINSCPLMYISVQSNAPPGGSLSSTCIENACRFPYNIRYQIQINEFGCYSGSGTVGFSVLLLILSIVINYI